MAVRILVAGVIAVVMYLKVVPWLLGAVIEHGREPPAGVEGERR